MGAVPLRCGTAKMFLKYPEWIQMLTETSRVDDSFSFLPSGTCFGL